MIQDSRAPGIPNERLVNGEISHQEYEKLKNRITETII